MAEPIKLYPSKGGDPIICASPSEASRLLRGGEWLLEPAPKQKPRAKLKPAEGKQ